MSSIPHVLIVILLISTVLVSVSCRGGGRGGGGRGGGRSGARSGRSGAARGSTGPAGRGRLWGMKEKVKGLFVKTRGPDARYMYHPPTGGISFTCGRCSGPASYPVYAPIPPRYVYRYRASNSRFGDLFAGLALYNLARSAARLHTPRSQQYASRTDEACCMQVVNKTVFEETIVPCFIISTFMDRSANDVPDSETDDLDITSDEVDDSSGTYLNDTGDPLDVSQNQDCLLWYNTSQTSTHSVVPCALLKEYAGTLETPGFPLYVWLPMTILASIFFVWLCRCCKMKNDYYQKVLLLKEPAIV